MLNRFLISGDIMTLLLMHSSKSHEICPRINEPFTQSTHSIREGNRLDNTCAKVVCSLGPVGAKRGLTAWQLSSGNVCPQWSGLDPQFSVTMACQHARVDAGLIEPIVGNKSSIWESPLECWSNSCKWRCRPGSIGSKDARKAPQRFHQLTGRWGHFACSGYRMQ